MIVDDKEGKQKGKSVFLLINKNKTMAINSRAIKEYKSSHPS